MYRLYHHDIARSNEKNTDGYLLAKITSCSTILFSELFSWYGAIKDKHWISLNEMRHQSLPF